ncbi:MAG: UDP-N-acetylmuramoyl-L-alanine--D-glutamate ligase, partial [Hydrogenophaga sp.]|nr:UDP-N-acetylmuramoyl-L-alanine--D-glutamate ligase [Hydrogenophaga sp.]
MNQLPDQHVLILGLGISGLSMARWCARHGARVTVADTREAPPSLDALHAECPGADFVSGAFDDALLARAPWTLIARSPGLPPEQLVTARAWALANGAAWVGELDLFALALGDLSKRERLPYRPKVLAITGTNGKTTVTSLTGLLMQRAGWRVAVAGNIGPALLDVLSQALDAECDSEAQDAEREAAEAAEAVEIAVGSVEDSTTGDSTELENTTDLAIEVPADVLSEDEDVLDGDGPAQLIPP